MNPRTISIALCLFACSEVSQEQTPDAGPRQPMGCDPTQPADVLLAALNRLECERQLECGVPIVNQGADLASCLEEERASALMASFLERGIAPDAQSVCLCYEAFAQGACEDLYRRSVDPSCASLFAGPAALGEPCSFAFDCQEGLVCDLSSQCPGACIQAPDSCVEGECPEGQYCSDNTNVCLPRAELGASCKFVPCLEGTFCMVSQDFETQICQRPSAPGEPCVPLEGACTEGHACQNEICSPIPGASEPCQAALECGTGQYCDFNELRCRVRGQEGDVCFNFDKSCADGLLCSYPERYECAPERGCVDGSQCCGVDGVGVCGPTSGDCDFIRGTCAREEALVLSVLQPGEDCSGQGVCPLGTTCDARAQRCLSLLAVGEVCDTNSLEPYQCEAGVCDLFGSGRCTRLKLPGEACDHEGAGLECLSFRCEQGRCVDWDESCR